MVERMSPLGLALHLRTQQIWVPLVPEMHDHEAADHLYRLLRTHAATEWFSQLGGGMSAQST